MCERPSGIGPLVERRADINRDLTRDGVRFGVYKGGEFREQIFPMTRFPASSGRLSGRGSPPAFHSGCAR
ncbi:MAG: hypothetical protein LKE37_04920 [Atopobiaceae bacterium]|jgi:hypothetical protein|nr:hypothetical protein [Atopobiaceae bacterium]